MRSSAITDKAALAAAELLRGFDYEKFRELLEGVVVGVAFDETTAGSCEGRATLSLLVNLLARLYPNIRIIELGDSPASLSPLADDLVSSALLVAPSLSIERGREFNSERGSAGCDSLVVVGATPVTSNAHALYLGSRGWAFGLSSTGPVGSGSSSNPFGAAAAACLGAAGVFRQVFGPLLKDPAADASRTAPSGGGFADQPLWFSLGGMRHETPGTDDGPRMDGVQVDIGETFLVGLGAVGNGAIWCLSRTSGLTGVLHLIDHESVDASNLQRYVLATPEDVGRSKVDLAAREMTGRLVGDAKSSLDIVPTHGDWAAFIRARGNYRLERVLMAVDSAQVRLEIQSSLPKSIINSWTQPENAGVSRHPSFEQGACVACLYTPLERKRNKDEIYADALAVSGGPERMELRGLLHSGRPVGEAFIRRTAERLGVSGDALMEFAARPVEDLYHDALCGGIVLRLTRGRSVAKAEVPMAFQSAFAGVLLASELVLSALGTRDASFPCRTEIDLLRPFPAEPNVPAAKLANGRCICQDPAYVRAYRAKYG